MAVSDPETGKPSGGARLLVATWRFVNRNVLTQVLSAILSLIIVARVTNWWTGPQSYKVYVVGSFNPPEETTLEVWQGFTANQLKLTINGVSVVTERANDAGDPKEAAKIAGMLAARNDTLMVIGHVLSTQSQAALPVYLGSEPPVPVILATETNPYVVPSNSPDESPYPVFRLSPTDDKQAEIAAEFAMEKLGKNRFWIIKNTNNSTYSSYLASNFQERVVKAGRQVYKITDTDNLPDPDDLRNASIDCVFFAGDESHAMMLIDHIESVPWARKPRIILSDWSVGPNLIPRTGNKSEGIFLTHPLSADVYNKEQYVWYGKQSHEVVEQLITDASLRFAQALTDKEPVSFFFKRILNIHRVADARTAVITIMNERHTFSTTPNITYAFDHYGQSPTSEFHIWQIQKQNFVECEPEEENCK
jgi:branched-chain amino acid transport system substrate-binding protein